MRPKPASTIPHAPSARIALRPPRHGWIECTIELGDFRVEEAASGVLNDPLAELIDLGIFLARRASGTHRVCLWGEPGGDALDVCNLGDTLAQVRVGRAADFIPPMTGRPLRAIHACTVERTVLARAIRRAVDELFENAGTALAHPHWDPPESYGLALAQLRAVVRR